MRAQVRGDTKRVIASVGQTDRLTNRNYYRHTFYSLPLLLIIYYLWPTLGYVAATYRNYTTSHTPVNHTNCKFQNTFVTVYIMCIK